MKNASAFPGLDGKAAGTFLGAVFGTVSVVLFFAPANLAGILAEFRSIEIAGLSRL
jgi:hypothetical protein